MIVYKCDICGKVEPRSIRRIVAYNPQVDEKSQINKEKIYAFNLFYGEFCEDCLYTLERTISNKIYELQRELKEQE